MVTNMKSKIDTNDFDQVNNEIEVIKDQFRHVLIMFLDIIKNDGKQGIGDRVHNYKILIEKFIQQGNFSKLDNFKPEYVFYFLTNAFKYSWFKPRRSRLGPIHPIKALSPQPSFDNSVSSPTDSKSLYSSFQLKNSKINEIIKGQMQKASRIDLLSKSKGIQSKFQV